jgi:MYXO-CTERM domain-containing protein
VDLEARVLLRGKLHMGTFTHSPQLVVLQSATASSTLHTVLIAMGIAIGGCATSEDDLQLGESSSELTVGGAVTSSCSTSTVRGLSVQIAQEVDCMSPGSLVKLSPSTRLRFASSAVLPYMYSAAKTDLIAAANQATITLNSGYRTVAQQYLLYRWDQANRCGISIAATPGRSNHESGRAVDISNASARASVMRAHHWARLAGDPPHFDNTRSPDNRGRDVRAFQRLWNRNHPGDKIGVDGIYGPQTAARLKASPATGFSKGAFCRDAIREVDVLAIDGPDKIEPGATAHYTFTMWNPSDVEWGPTTKLVVAGGGASELFDAATWASPSEVGEIGVAIAPMTSGKLDFDITAPQVLEETAGFTAFALVANGQQLATLDLAVTITPNGDAGTSGDAEPEEENADPGADEDGVVPEDGGCSTGRGASWGFAAFALAFAVRRRRRAHA